LRKLPPDLEDLAAGRRDVLRPRRKPRGRLSDSRVRGLLPGVANHDARRVYDERLSRMAAALAGGDEGALGVLLAEAVLLGLWRARNVMGFDALGQDVLGVGAERARALAEQGAAELGVPLEPLPDVAVALWLRSEAALFDHVPDARVSVRSSAGRVELIVSAPLSPVSAVAEAAAAVGRSAAGLARAIDQERGFTAPPRRPPGPRRD
jgi:hypothetical protein